MTLERHVMNHEFRMGDCVRLLKSDDQSTYGVVTDFSANKVEVTHFDYGFPSVIEQPYDSLRINKVTRGDVLEHFHRVSKSIIRGVWMNPLFGAIGARKKHYLDNIIERLENPKQDPYYGVTIAPPAPMTGIFVAMGIYSGQGPSEHLQGLKVNPRVSERTLGSILTDTRPDGLGAIPGEVNNTAATSHGDLVKYAAYEVPAWATHIVEKPIRLSLNYR
jgi:hypothetical protein